MPEMVEIREPNGGEPSEFQPTSPPPPPPEATPSIDFEPFEVDLSQQRRPEVKDNTLSKMASYTRLVMYAFFILYTIFCILIWITGHINLIHKEHIISTAAYLEFEPLTYQYYLVFTSLLLLICAMVGFFAFTKRSFKAFVAFSLMMVGTIMFTVVTLNLTFKAYKKMDQVSIGQVADQFEKTMELYDWFDEKNQSSIFINKFQSEFRCCGGRGRFQDWERLKPNSLAYGAFPATCCFLHFDNNLNLEWCTYDTVVKTPGCPASFNAHLNLLLNNFKTINTLLIETVLCQMLTISVFGFMLYRMIKYQAFL